MFKLLQLLVKNKKLLIKTAVGVLIFAMALTIWLLVADRNNEIEHREVIIEESPIEIESVRPKGEIYVCSAIIEDYTTMQKKETYLGIMPRQHSCVQMLRQKCSYKIDLDKVEYKKDTLNKVFVYLPELEYTASTQNSPFMSDDEDFWIKNLPNTNGMKKKVASQIRARFDTQDNRNKARAYAESSLSVLLAKLGYEAEFISNIEMKEKQ